MMTAKKPAPDCSQAEVEMANAPIKPSDFMRARRPELYSDTTFVDEPALSRSQFEFHLDTLTQRKDEIRFEHFCRRLAEKELCPNLLPQTGPTGGGDSKTDAETYPVADSIAERWYIGDPSKAAQERWAFAFSAKKDWRPKVRSDVEKIVETGRSYALIYFITNQSISDRNRAAIEDELRQQWNVLVRILDRTWIVEKVIQNKRWEVVYQTLDIDAPRIEHRQLHGPQDAGRLLELEEIDHQLESSERYQGADYQLFEDCLHTALLVRGLGRPRTEIDGRFERAERIARRSGGTRQLFRVIYMFGVDALKHRDLRVYSPINMPLWDKARWRGLGFAIGPGTQPVPELALMFENLEAGVKIFRGWNKRLGKVDLDEWICLTIITGTDKNHPAHYRVAISVNPNLLFQEGKQAAFVVRMQDMTPSDSTNLDRFIGLFEKAGSYHLSLGQMVDRQMTPYNGSEFSIEKRQLRIVPAWQIGPNDPASGAIGGITNPLIPPEESDPPIIRTLEKRQKHGV
jgi:hypothetical protein